MRILQVKIALLSLKSGIPKPFDLSPNIKVYNIKRDQMNGPKVLNPYFLDAHIYLLDW